MNHIKTDRNREYFDELYAQSEKYTKMQLMEAFTVEVETRKQLNKELNDERRISKQLEYEKQLYFDKWLRMFVKENVAITGDVEESLDYFFSHPSHRTFMTSSGGFYCVTQEEDCLFIHYAWHNPKEWKSELKEMTELIRRISDYAGQPIRYTGVSNIMKNHSKEIAPDLFELML